MVAYKLYKHDKSEEVHLVGIMPERRQNQERITKESIMNFGRTILGHDKNINNISFIRVTLDESTGRIFGPGTSKIRTRKGL